MLFSVHAAFSLHSFTCVDMAKLISLGFEVNPTLLAISSLVEIYHY